MAEQFNGLRPDQAERLFYLLKELGEAQQAIGKILRHGYMSYDPTINETPRTTNRMMLERELGDVVRAMYMMTKAGDLNPDRIDAVVIKGPPIKYMHHQCVHEWIDIRNSVVLSGSMCRKCNALRAEDFDK